MRANGYRIRQRPDISSTTRQPASSPCRRSRRWCSPTLTVPSICCPRFDMAAVMLENQPLVEPAFRSGKGVGWGNQSQCLFCTTGRFFRPGYQNNLVGSWLPTLDGVAAKLESGAKVADVGCGHGFSTIIMAKAFPKSTFVGYDFHPRLGGAGAGSCRAAWSDREHEVRSRHGERFSRQGPGPGDVLRLPA